MPGIWPFNNIATQNVYRDTVMAQFPRGRSSFALQVYSAGVYYKLLRYVPPGQYYLDDYEHFLATILAHFDDPVKEGLAPGELFGGIAFRSALTDTPATVTVI